jgi:hypothetical protein
MLTVEELLRDRIKIIADYPGNKFKVGDILTYSHNFLPTMIVGVGNQIWRNQEGVIVSYNKFKDFPHLFQPLPWWSDREIEDLPKYVRCHCYGSEDERVGGVAIVEQGRILNENAIWLLRDDKICFMWPLKYLSPISENDYEQYNQQKEGKNV